MANNLKKTETIIEKWIGIKLKEAAIVSIYWDSTKNPAHIPPNKMAVPLKKFINDEK